MKYSFLLIALLMLIGCSDSTTQEMLQKVQDELALAQSEIELLKTQIEQEGSLVHFVFFKVKSDANQEALIAAIQKLEGIKEVKDLQVGPFENLGDDRALNEYQLVMEMSFDDVAAYKNYQAHPLHLSLKENIKPFLAGPPATYDYAKK